MKRLVFHLLWIAGLTLSAAAVAQDTSCCTIVGLDTKRQLIIAIEQKTGKMFRFTVKDAAIFKTAKLCEAFDGPVGETKEDGPFAADFGKADPKTPCCTLSTEIGAVGQVLGMRKYAEPDVTVILTELKRTSGDTLTARWQYCNGGAKTVTFPAGGLHRHGLQVHARARHELPRPGDEEEAHDAEGRPGLPRRGHAPARGAQGRPEPDLQHLGEVPGATRQLEGRDRDHSADERAVRGRADLAVSRGGA
ncbi:MAG: hypothetical protein FJZ38_21695 [Candidatus Rokubacteria bacterium]|nr:hypothetical protein [Candidatus Rokubacteria bacterium]